MYYNTAREKKMDVININCRIQLLLPSCLSAWWMKSKKGFFSYLKKEKYELYNLFIPNGKNEEGKNEDIIKYKSRKTRWWYGMVGSTSMYSQWCSEVRRTAGKGSC